MSLLKVNEIQIFNGTTVTITAPAVVTANDTTNAALRITQTGTGNALVVEDSANPDSTAFVVDASGNVGIGTTSPTVPLQLAYTTGVPDSSLLTSDAAIITAENTAPGFAFVVASNSSAQRGVFKATRARGTLAAPTVPISNDDTFSLLGAIYDGVITRATAAINIAVDGAVSDGVAPQRITFLTGETTTRLERMRIDSAGNVGIGTSSPSQKLDVSGNINATGALTLGTALAIAEGGTGATDAATARTNLDVDQAGTDNSTDVTLVTTSHDYLSIAGQSITLGPIDLAADVTGSLPYASISGTPTLGTAAAEDVGYFATAAQGSLADSAVQPGDDASTLGSGAATDGQVLTADGSGGVAWEAVSGGGGGGTVSGRNLIINGDFRVNQRGAVSRTATSNAYNYDRWYYDGTYLYQVIEDLNVVNGDYTISWSGSGLTAGWVISSNTTSSIPTGFTTVTSGSSFTVSGKTTGDHLWIRFGGTLTNLADVQVEAGTVATPFERRLIGTELALCQRYYEKHTFNDNDYTNATGFALSSVSYFAYTFQVPKRTTPTYSANGNWRGQGLSDTAGSSSVTLASTSNNMAFLFLLTASYSGTQGLAVNLQAKSNGAYIVASAEL